MERALRRVLTQIESLEASGERIINDDVASPRRRQDREFD
jgi:hypothetical protein